MTANLYGFTIAANIFGMALCVAAIVALARWRP